MLSCRSGVNFYRTPFILVRTLHGRQRDTIVCYIRRAHMSQLLYFIAVVLERIVTGTAGFS